ncbi:MAG: hypothetical protein ACXX52_05235 [Candidatus Liberibacter asiaticus]
MGFLDSSVKFGSSLSSGFKLGSIFGPVGGVIGGLMGGAAGLYSEWDTIGGFFGSSQKEGKKEEEDVRPLEGDELAEVRRQESLRAYEMNRIPIPARRFTSSSLLSGVHVR